MGEYRARDLVGVPGLLSLARIPLAAAFPFVVDRPVAALSILFVSGVTDVLDGYWARTFNQASTTGAALDPITDKLFVTIIVVTLILTHRLAPLSIVLLSTREIGEIPLVGYL